MSATNADLERSWDCGWDGHRLAQLRRLARLPFGDKLDWLEEAQQLAENLQNTPRQTPSGRTAETSTHFIAPEASAPRPS